MEKQWIPWQLAPDSDPQERFILVSPDGNVEHPNGKKYTTEAEAEADVAVTRCFTFGSSSAAKHGVPFPSFVRISAASAEACRDEMVRVYGRDWAFDYSEEQIAEQQKRFPKLLEVPVTANRFSEENPKLLEAQLRHIFIEIANGRGRHGSFLVNFSQAFSTADEANQLLMGSAALAIAKKYTLAKYLDSFREGQ